MITTTVTDAGEAGAIEIIDGGLQTTVQDGGRVGALAKGIPPAGVQDFYSMSLVNLLVDNDLTPPPLSIGSAGAAGLEMPLKGATLQFKSDCVFALGGADMAATLDSQPVQRYNAILARSGSVLKIGFARTGARGYFAVSGGIEVPLVMGSRATYVRGRLGGMEGRALRAGDLLRVGLRSGPLPKLVSRELPNYLPNTLDEPHTVRVVLGPQDKMFTDDAVAQFLDLEWQLSPTSDRMGMRLIGPRLPLKPRPDYLFRDAGSGPADIVDDIIPIGGIQVAGGIEPIVMGVENPTVGGYAKIATVISTDLCKMGQLKPWGFFRFRAVGASEAIDISRDLWGRLQMARRELDGHRHK